MSEDVILKLIYDDSQAVEGLNKLSNTIGKAETGMDSLNQSTKELNQAVGKDLVKANQQAEKSLNNVVQKTVQGTTAMEKQKAAVQETAIAILKSGDSAAKFAALMERLGKVKLSGAVSDIQDLEKEFTDLLQTVELTEDQIKILVDNIDEVAQVISSLSGEEFEKLANDAQETTNEFFNAKKELKELTKLINSGQLTGEELQQATARAAQLTDKIGDTRDRIKQLASSTRALDLGVESVSALTSGFQVYEGVMALAGDESEEFQKTLVKLNAVMAIANGLQQAGEILTKKGGIATQIATGIQTTYSLAVGGTSGALKLFRIALAATGVGLLVILLGSLIANFDTVKEKISNLFPGLKNLSTIFAGVKNSLIGFFKDFGGVFQSLTELDFSGAYKKFKELGSNIVTNYEAGKAEKLAKEGRDVAAADLEKLAKAQRKRAEILEAGGKDSYNVIKTASENEIKALKLKGATTEEIEEKEFELQKFQIERKKKLDDEKAAANKKAAEEQNKANLKQAELLKEYKDRFSQAIQDIQDLSAEFGIISEEEKFDIVKARTIQQFKDLKEELIKTGNFLDKDFSKSLANIDKLIKEVEGTKFIKINFDTENDQFNIDNLLKDAEKRNLIRQREIEESILSEETKQEILTQIQLEGEKERLNIMIEYGDKSSVEYQQNLLKLAEINNKLAPPPVSVSFEPDRTGFEKVFDEVNNLQDLIQNIFEELFKGKLPEDIEEFLGGAFTLVNEFGNLLDEANQLKLDAIDKQLDALAERRERAQEELDKELEFEKEGLANNVINKQAEVTGLLAEEERLTKEREKIQADSRKRELIAETANQAASLISASIDVIKGSQKLFPGPIGLGIGIAAVGALFAFFAATKAKAFAATKLYTGAKRIDDHFGEAVPNGRTDIPGRGEGYRLIDAVTGEDTNVRISGREMLLPESVTSSQKEFFNNLMTGKYNNIDIAKTLDFSKNQTKKIMPINSNVIVNVPKKQYVSFRDKKGRYGAKLLDIPETGTDIIYFDI